MKNIAQKADKLNIAYQVKSNLSTYKELDTSNRTIKAVVNTLNYFDYDYDVLRPGVANKSINERGAASNSPDKILHLLFHDFNQMVGKTLEEKETTIDGKKVLYTESYLPETTDGENTLLKYESGIYNQHSIGFRYTQIEYVEEGSSEWDSFLKNLINPDDAQSVGFGYDVKEINWFEWSTVAFGANKLTPYLGVKTQNKAVQLQNLYTKLDALIEKAKRFEIKNKHMFELQYRQLKQMINELMYQKPDIKTTLEMEPGNKSTLDYHKLLKHF